MATRHSVIPAAADESAIDNLRSIHERYKHDQGESRKDELLAEWGHPKAPEYQALREFFEALQWAANMDARYYSFEHERECVEFWAPSLGNRDVHMTRLLTRQQDRSWSEIYQGQLDILDPETADTYFKPGSWIVTTEDEDFFAAFHDLIREEMERGIHSPRAPNDYGGRTINWTPDDKYVGRIFCQSFAEVKQVKALLDEWVTPLADAEVPTPE